MLAAGCSRKAVPVVVTPELEAKQRENEQNVQAAESARQQTQKPPMSREQAVQEAESARQRRGGR